MNCPPLRDWKTDVSSVRISLRWPIDVIRPVDKTKYVGIQTFTSTAGCKINFFSGNHLAPKYFKVVANSKKLVAIMTQKKCDKK